MNTKGKGNNMNLQPERNGDFVYVDGNELSLDEAKKLRDGLCGCLMDTDARAKPEEVILTCTECDLKVKTAMSDIHKNCFRLDCIGHLHMLPPGE